MRTKTRNEVRINPVEKATNKKTIAKIAVAIVFSISKLNGITPKRNPVFLCESIFDL
jgi:hypothetical protein